MSIEMRKEDFAKMDDKLLTQFFEKERWEKAIKKALGKNIDKTELKALCSPSTRAFIYKIIAKRRYRIAPPHQQLIPKDNGDYRTVYINENLDRILLSIMNDLLFENCSKMIHPACKSYQPGIGCGKIVKEVSRNICKSTKEIVGFKADLSKYFDSVPIEYIDCIFESVEKIVGKSAIIDLLREYYHTDLCFDTEGNLIQHYQSLKQGCSVASFLADTVLYSIDETMSKLPGYYVRYSDDILYIGGKYEEAKHLLETKLDQMKLVLNPKKVEWLYKDKWFKFLGFNIKGDKITLSKSRVKTFQKEIEKRSIKKEGVTEKKALNAINQYLYKGDGEYSWATNVLPIINVKKDIDTLNNFVIDCIRAANTHKTKIGGLGSVSDRSDYTILRGKGRNVANNRIKTEKIIEGYYSIGCMQRVLLIDREVFDALVRLM